MTHTTKQKTICGSDGKLYIEHTDLKSIMPGTWLQPGRVRDLHETPYWVWVVIGTRTMTHNAYGDLLSSDYREVFCVWEIAIGSYNNRSKYSEISLTSLRDYVAYEEVQNLP